MSISRFTDSTGETFPATSVCSTSIVYVPSVRAGERSHDHTPVGSTVAVQLDHPAIVTSTVLPGSPVQATVGVVSLVTELSIGSLIVTAAGAVVSISTSIILL